MTVIRGKAIAGDVQSKTLPTRHQTHTHIKDRKICYTKIRDNFFNITILMPVALADGDEKIKTECV